MFRRWLAWSSFLSALRLSRLTRSLPGSDAHSGQCGLCLQLQQETYERLASFEQWAKTQLALSDLLYADETGINIGAKRHWLHCASNASLTWFDPHARRGIDAMDEMGILPFFKGALCHDHWKPYRCFLPMEGAMIFCRVRSYLSTCRKQGMTATHALTLLFQGKDLDFMKMDKAKDS